MNRNNILETVWSLPVEEIDCLKSGIDKIHALKIELNGSKSSNGSPIIRESDEAPLITPRNIVATPRTPLRPPKPGSLRETIHAILRKADKPLRRAEIIQTVAEIKSLPLDDKLKAKVGQVLTFSLDPKIRKVAYGIYRYQEDPNHGMAF